MNTKLHVCCEKVTKHCLCQPLAAKSFPLQITQESPEVEAYKISRVTLVDLFSIFNLFNEEEHMLHHKNKADFKTEQKMSTRQLL